MDLVNRCQRGDEQAFAQLFHQYKNLVFKTAYLVLNNQIEAEDVLQEVFTKVHRSISTYDPARGAFKSWLYRITLNHCLSRRRKIRPAVVGLDEVAPLATPTSAIPPQLDQLATADTVEHALSRLSEKQQVMVILRYYAELSYAEIAEVLDIPIGTVKSGLNRALRILRRELETVDRLTLITGAGRER